MALTAAGGRSGLGKLIRFQRWLVRWRSILSQWAEIEASMQQHYGVSGHDMMQMSWRRFVVLFRGIFSWKEDPDSIPNPLTNPIPGYAGTIAEEALKQANYASGEIQRSVQWPSSRDVVQSEIITTEQLLTGSHTAKGNRVAT